MNLATRLYGLMNGAAVQRHVRLRQSSPALAQQAALEILRVFDSVLTANQSPEKARAAAEAALASFERKLPEWQERQRQLRIDYESRINAGAVADQERRANDQATCNHLSAPQIIELARSEGVALQLDDSGHLVATGTPSCLLRAHIRLNRNDVASILRNRIAQEVF